MSWTKFSHSSRRIFLSGTIITLLAFALFIGAQQNPVEAQSKKSDANLGATIHGIGNDTIPGTGVGPIPDGTSLENPPNYGPPLVVSFLVSGATQSITSMSVNFTLSHTYVGDVDVVLAAPGGSPSMVVVSRIGVVTSTGFGDNSNYLGNYRFSNDATGPNIWTAASGECNDVCNVANASYRSTQGGMDGQTNPAPPTNFLTTFGSLTPAQINGNWTLTFRDAAIQDTGTVTDAGLFLGFGGTPPSNPQHYLDFDGNGRTDFVVVRNNGGGFEGQMTWFIANNGTPNLTAADWGLGADFFTPGDFDGDNKTDIAIWRSAEAGTAGFYILQSQTGTFRFEQFGQDGDDPTVIGDYDGDGKFDPAVYRAGDQSTWFYRGSLSNPGGNTTYVQWGQRGDFPSPGDYDGDGKHDFVIQRNNGNDQAVFWRNQTTAGTDVIFFGYSFDTIVPGDYDGDGKTDIATARRDDENILWFVRPSSTGAVSGSPFAVFGLSFSDYLTQGDYDGDGKTDPSIWRPNPDEFQNYFWYLGSTNGVNIFEWGKDSDIPVANYNTH